MRTTAINASLYATFISIALAATTSSASAHTRHVHSSGSAHRAGHHGIHHASYHRHLLYGAHVIQCVAFAKQDAGIEIRGNARDWWGRAAGVYDRGSDPETGSVLSFRETGRMPLGHVAVVSATVDSRTIFIDQSHWGSRGIVRDVEVKDVSENNDWSAVRVQLKPGGEFGSIYPTHGFIYPRPDSGRVMASNNRSEETVVEEAPVRVRHVNLEVAEVPSKPLDLSINGIMTDAPNRALR